MITLNECSNEILMSLGARPSSEKSTLHIVNKAGLWLCSRGWRWLEGSSTFATSSGVDYVALNGLANLQSVSTVVAFDAGTPYTLQPGDMSEVVLARLASESAFRPRFWCLQYNNAADSTFNPRLQLGPTPTSVLTLHVQYGLGWQGVRAGNDQNRIPVPPFMESLFLEAVRVFARGSEEEDNGTTSERLDGLVSGRLYLDARAADALSQANRGQHRKRGDVGLGVPRFPESWAS